MTTLSKLLRFRSKSSENNKESEVKRVNAFKHYKMDHPEYTLDSDGMLLLRKTGKVLSERDLPLHAAPAVSAMVDVIQKHMINELGFIEEFIPNETTPIRCKVFMSANYKDCKRLLVFVTSSNGVCPGIWSRSLLLKSGINAGSMLPYMQRAMHEGYGILVTNPNANSIVSSSTTNNKISVSIEGSETPERHMEYVWDHFIRTSQVRRVFFVGFGYGGVLVKHILDTRGEELIRRNGAIALIESSHKVEDSDAQYVKTILAHRSVCWQSSQVDYGMEIVNDAAVRTGCTMFSAGMPTMHGSSNLAYTVNAVMEPLFAFFKVRDVGLFMRQEKVITRSRARTHEVASSSWGPNKFAAEMKKECALCDLEFTMFDRRHHCRMCIRPICNACSPDRLFLPGSSTAKRVCMQCAEKDTSEIIQLSTEEILPNDACKNVKRDSLNVDDFKLLKVIGKGAFGKVMLVKRKDEDSTPYAMKVLKKAFLVAKNQVEHTKSERRILRDIDHPFVVRLRYAFQSEDKLYLIMDYYNGGSLFFHLRKARRFRESHARFYAAQLVLAMEHLHQCNIAYRDLKLENILMDDQGYIALTDFGLSKEDVDVPNGAKTFCGTAEYIAPELLRGSGYGKAVDWWSFGTLLYEMMTGQVNVHSFRKTNRCIF